MTKRQTPRWGWALTGSGHFLKESLALIRELEHVDIFLSKAGGEVLRMYKQDLELPKSVRIYRDTSASSVTVGQFYYGIYHTLIVAPATSTWAGFYWQYPDNNWGTMQPITIATGAKDVSFWAKGMAGGESITFEAGGIMNQVSAATPYTDGFAVTQTFQLTKAWTKYTLPMTGLTYAGGVLGGFAWVSSVSNTNPVTFFIDGIVWE